MESFELGSEKLQNFILHDKIDVERSNEWRYRLPWPLFDMTSVKIPVISNICKADLLISKDFNFSKFVSSKNMWWVAQSNNAIFALGTMATRKMSSELFEAKEEAVVLRS